MNACTLDDKPMGSVVSLVRVALLTLILGGLALRVVYPESTVFCDDQARACALAEDIASGQWESGGLVNSGGFRNLPGYVYLLAAVWWVFPSPAALIVFTNLANVLAVLLAGWLMMRWVGRSAGLWAMAFLATSPWAIQYSRWIWAQHLLYPLACLIYLFLWQWVAQKRRWALLGLALSLGLMVQVHLAGVVCGLAIVLYWLWARPWIYAWPMCIGVVLVVTSVVPYLQAGHLDSPGGSRVDYVYFWRVIPAALMSVTGVGWQLEFNDGYSRLLAHLGGRQWVYLAAMGVVLLVFGVGMVMAIGRLWSRRRSEMAQRRDPVTMAAALCVLIPVSFVLLGIRTSPTYLPMWYPLPFLLMGWAVEMRVGRLNSGAIRGVVQMVLLGAMALQLGFFADQLQYTRRCGGIPGGLGMDYQTLERQAVVIAESEDDSMMLNLECKEMICPIQYEALVYLVRRQIQKSRSGSPQPIRLIRFIADPSVAEGRPVIYQFQPWTPPHQSGGKIPAMPTP